MYIHTHIHAKFMVNIGKKVRQLRRKHVTNISTFWKNSISKATLILRKKKSSNRFYAYIKPGR